MSSTVTPVKEESAQLIGLMAEFEDVTSVFAATEKVRDAGFKNFDVHAPFPIHHIDRAMGMKPTKLPWIALCGGLIGLTFGASLVYFSNAITPEGAPVSLQGYQFLISGKPLFSLPANIPILFETTILFTAFAIVLGMLRLNNLPMHYNPLFKSDRFRRATQDKFFIVIDADDDQFDKDKTQQFLFDAGAEAIEEVWD